jgi:hypothetical protein
MSDILFSAQTDPDIVLSLAAFAGEALRCRTPEIGDWDGGAMQSAMVRAGLLAEVEVTEACGEACICADYDEFPQRCLALTDIGRQCLAAVDEDTGADGGTS